MSDLQRFLDGRSVQARPVAVWEHAGKWAKRRPVHAALAMVLAVAVVAVLGGLEWGRSRERHLNDELRIERDRSRQSASEALEKSVLADRLRVPKQLQLANSSADEMDYESAMGFLDTLRPREDMPDSRSFAWHYLHRLVRPHVRTLPALPERVRTVAHAPDGRTIALADNANNTFLMDLNTGTLRELPASHRFSFCRRLVFSPDGRTLASLSPGAPGVNWPYSEIKVWDTSSGAELGGMTENFGICYQLLFSPDGGRLITVEAIDRGSPAPVRSWSISDDQKRVMLSEVLRGKELKSRLSSARRIADSPGGSFQLSDVLAVTPDDDSTTAVSLDTGEIWLYTTNTGYYRAGGVFAGPPDTGFRRMGQNGPALERRQRRPAHETSGSHRSCFRGRIFARRENVGFRRRRPSAPALGRGGRVRAPSTPDRSYWTGILTRLLARW
jgi:hypothetical protein